MKRFLLIFCLGLILTLSTSASPQTPVRCNNCGGSGGVFTGYNYYGQPVFGPCPICGGTGAVMVYPQPTPQPTPKPKPNSNTKFGMKDIYKKETKPYVDCSECKCTVYKGYKNVLSTKYEGNCEKCGHSPEAHGLNK